MVNVKGRYKAHGSEQQEFCIFKKQKKQKGEPGMRTAICMSCMSCGKEKCAPDVSV